MILCKVNPFSEVTWFRFEDEPIFFSRKKLFTGLITKEIIIPIDSQSKNYSGCALDIARAV